MRPLYTEPGSPRESDYSESFNSRLRDELLNGEINTTLTEFESLSGLKMIQEIAAKHKAYPHQMGK